jgi:VanZ family protein
VRRNGERPRAELQLEIGMFYKLVPMTAWACLLFVAFATVSPAYLRPRLMQPESPLTILLEHVGAFAVIGFLFSVTYSRTTLVCILVLGGAVILELMQLVVPDRDARVMDAVQKLIGGGAGIVAARIMCALVFTDSERQEPPPGMKNEIGQSPAE